MSRKIKVRARFRYYFFIVLTFVCWFLVSDYLDRQQQSKIAALREMHRLGRGPDIDAILSDPARRSQKRFVYGGVFVIVVVAGLEWRLRRQGASGASEREE